MENGKLEGKGEGKGKKKGKWKGKGKKNEEGEREGEGERKEEGEGSLRKLDAWTHGQSGDFILCPMLCYVHWTDNNSFYY